MVKSVFSKNRKKGQGLVEYALLLVLVVIIVIVVLLILGPRIGNIFSKVNSALPAASSGGGQPTPGAPTWKTCASENGYCSFTGTAPVRYGANGVWTTQTFTNGVACNNSVFGDPLYGVVKSCQVYQ
jgi:Flp pilus assembly pilin Flp